MVAQPTPPPQPPTRFPGYPTLAADPLSWSDRRHLLYGDEDDEESGGHMSGVGRPGKTEFPPSWDEGDCTDGVIGVAREPERAVKRPTDGTWIVEGTHRNVVIRAFVRQEGTISAGHPISGPGVRRNPRTDR